MRMISVIMQIAVTGQREIFQIPFPFGPPTHSRSSKSSKGHFSSLNNLKLPATGREYVTSQFGPLLFEKE